MTDILPLACSIILSMLALAWLGRKLPDDRTEAEKRLDAQW